MADPGTVIIDVRENGELPEPPFSHRKIPLSTFDVPTEIAAFKNIIVFCQSGARSAKAAGILQQRWGNEKNIFHLDGGITGYNLTDHEQTS